MDTFVMIGETPHQTDTAEQIAAAQAALAEAGEQQAPVFVGDPDGDHHRNGQVLFAVTVEAPAK